jgi:hypothetical protein
MMKGGEIETFMTVGGKTKSKEEVTSMKSSFAKLVLILVVVGLTNLYGEVRAAEWREFAEATTGIFNYDEASISSTPEGYVRVWIHNVTKQETDFVEFNCKGASYHVLDVIQYDEAGHIKSRETYYDNPTHNWYEISAETVPQFLYGIVCR